METNVIINGEIYIKKNPDIYDASGELSELDRIIYDLEFETTKENPDMSLFQKLELAKRSKEDLLDIDGEIDYSNMDDYYQAYSDGKNFYIVNSNDKSNVLKFNTIEELKKNFISLADFLNNGTFIGKNFYRTKPAEYNDEYDSSYMKSKFLNNYNIVLYEYNDTFLVKKISPITNNSIIVIVDLRYVRDKNYEFYGDIMTEYSDKKQIYKEIINQCYNNVGKKEYK